MSISGLFPNQNFTSLSQAEVAAIAGDLDEQNSVSLYRATLTDGGVTDNYAAMNTQIAFARQTGKEYFIPEGEFYSSLGFVLDSHTQIRMHPNAIVKFANDFVGSGDLSSYCAGFSANGTYGTKIALSANCLKRSLTVSVGDASSFAEGDLVLVGSELQYRDNVCSAGELQYIADITGTTITLRGGVRDEYLTADQAFIQKITPVEGIRFKGGTITSTVDGHTGSSHVGLRSENAVDVVFEDVTVKSFSNIGIELCNTLQGQITGCRGYDVGWSESNGTVNGTGYFTLCSQATEGAVISNCFSERCGKGGDVSGRSSMEGVSRDIKWVDCHFKDCTRQVVGLHANSHRITFQNITGNCVQGLNLRSWDLTLDNCHFIVEGNTAGMSFSTDARAGFFHMRNSTVFATGSEALSIRGSTSDGGTQDYLDIEISNTVLESEDGIALEIAARADSDVLGLVLNNVRAKTNGVFPALRIEGDNSESVRDGQIMGGRFLAPNSTTGAVDLVVDSGSVIELQVVNTLAEGGAYGLHVTNTGGTLTLLETNNRFIGSTAATLGV